MGSPSLLQSEAFCLFNVLSCSLCSNPTCSGGSAHFCPLLLTGLLFEGCLCLIVFQQTSEEEGVRLHFDISSSAESLCRLLICLHLLVFLSQERWADGGQELLTLCGLGGGGRGLELQHERAAVGTDDGGRRRRSSS